MNFIQNGGVSIAGFGWSKEVWTVFTLLMVWSIIWKGLALWKAAKQDKKGWFVILLIVNTIGILEILYLYVFSKEKTHCQQV